MSEALAARAAVSLPARPATNDPGVAVFVALLVVALVAIPWEARWPEGWSIPLADWISAETKKILDEIRPVGRAMAAVMEYPLQGVNFVLTELPWPAIVGTVLALAWWVGGWQTAMVAVIVLGFVLASGYWVEGMNTLALVGVSVPLALGLGLLIGVLAHEIRAVRKAVETVLDIMQTVPTFAYLTPLLVFFGFGPVVGLIASAIYAAPPMARNVILGLERVDPEIREAAVMSGAARLQQILLVKIPAAGRQILVGVNQCVMAALSMVIIAAVIGGFDDIGWEVLLTMRKGQFGDALLAGLVIVGFAVLIDRMTSALAEARRGDRRIAGGLFALGIGAALVLWLLLPAVPEPGSFAAYAQQALEAAGRGAPTGAAAFAQAALDTPGLGLLDGVADAVDERLSTFTREHGAALGEVKNAAMFYGLLPLRIGLDEAVLPFTWGFQWTQEMSLVFFAIAAALAALAAWRGRLALAIAVAFAAAVLHTGVTSLPWPVVIAGVAALGYRAGGLGLAVFAGLGLLAILAIGFWDRAMLSIYLCGAAVIACALVGGLLGLLAALVPPLWTWVLRPVCDTLQTIPLFVFLIPVLMFFQIGEFSAFLAICAYAIVPMIRYTRFGLINTPPDLIEAAVASGATPLQILRDVRAPYAAPSILLGLNQTILYAFAMLVIAALIGTTGLGQSIYLALGQSDMGLGIAAGASMALLALIADRMVQAFAAERRAALGL